MIVLWEGRLPKGPRASYSSSYCQQVPPRLCSGLGSAPPEQSRSSWLPVPPQYTCNFKGCYMAPSSALHHTHTLQVFCVINPLGPCPSVNRLPQACILLLGLQPYWHPPFFSSWPLSHSSRPGFWAPAPYLALHGIYLFPAWALGSLAPSFASLWAFPALLRLQVL